MRHPAEFCSTCGGEKDDEGWCANYCMDDDDARCIFNAAFVEVQGGSFVFVPDHEPYDSDDDDL